MWHLYNEILMLTADRRCPTRATTSPWTGLSLRRRDASLRCVFRVTVVQAYLPDSDEDNKEDLEAPTYTDDEFGNQDVIL